MNKKYVGILICGIFIAILVWDAFLYADNVPGNSISQVIVSWSKASPLVPWFTGLVMGFLGAHWFDTTSQGEK